MPRPLPLVLDTDERIQLQDNGGLNDYTGDAIRDRRPEPGIKFIDGKQIAAGPRGPFKPSSCAYVGHVVRAACRAPQGLAAS